MKNSKYLIARLLLVVSILSFSFISAASESPRIDFFSKNFLTSGQIADGTLLGNGRVVWNGPHEGFVLWLEGAGSQPAGQVVTLINSSNSNRPILVRIECDLPATQEEGGRGLRVITNENSVNFRILANGDQKVYPGVWNFTISAALIINKNEI